jgi:plasmid stabilization system protein ParE
MMAQHADFLAQVSIEAADRLLSQFEKIADRIADNPLQFPIADELDFPDIEPGACRKCLFEGRYKALFQLEDKEAVIIAVIDSRMGNISKNAGGL